MDSSELEQELAQPMTPGRYLALHVAVSDQYHQQRLTLEESKALRRRINAAHEGRERVLNVTRADVLADVPFVPVCPRCHRVQCICAQLVSSPARRPRP